MDSSKIRDDPIYKSQVPNNVQAVRESRESALTLMSENEFYSPNMDKELAEQYGNLEKS